MAMGICWAGEVKMWARHGSGFKRATVGGSDGGQVVDRSMGGSYGGQWVEQRVDSDGEVGKGVGQGNGQLGTSR